MMLCLRPREGLYCSTEESSTVTFLKTVDAVEGECVISRYFLRKRAFYCVPLSEDQTNQ